jgi:hypothetical protein
MPGKGLKVDVTRRLESTLSFDEALDALDALVGRRVLVSIADELHNACGSVYGVLTYAVRYGDDAETGALAAFDIGVNGLVILSRAAFVGASTSRVDGVDYLLLQNGAMLLTVREGGPIPEEEVV